MPRLIYVLKNETMPGLVKIGLTTDTVESRISNLSSSTGVPLPFECHFAAEIPEEVNLGSLQKTENKAR
ncbi:GIY-YIG nuclease family protein [Pseudomonas mohnii]